MAESSVALPIAVEPLLLALFSVSVAFSITWALLQLLVVRLVCFSLPCQVRNGSSWCWWDDWHKSRFLDPRENRVSPQTTSHGKTFSYKTALTVSGSKERPGQSTGDVPREKRSATARFQGPRQNYEGTCLGRCLCSQTRRRIMAS